MKEEKQFYSQRKLTSILEKIDKLSEQKELQFINHRTIETLEGDSVAVLIDIYEGEKFIRTVIWEFPSYQKAIECHDSKEYQAGWNLAKDTTVRHMQVIEGFNTV